MPKKQAGENSKKVAGNAKKADAAAAKQAVKDKQAAAVEDAKWNKGAKDTKKTETAAEKKAEADRKKEEKARLLAEEEASLPSKPKGAGTKTAQKKNAKGGAGSGLDSALSFLDAPSSSKPSTISASGIDNALDALSLTGSSANEKVDRHPERRFPAAYKAFEERRLEGMKDEKGLRRQQKIDMIRKEFEKHPDNPFNQVHGRYDMSKEEIKEMKERERSKVEDRLASP